jgi:hypothetical protein
MRRGLVPLLLSVLLLGTACAAPTLYYWGSYEDDLYRSYKNPEEEGRFHASLLQIIQKSDQKAQKPPPGICAEYGYALYKDGKLEQAVAYLEREQREWPRSAPLMEKLIANMQRNAEPGPESQTESGSEPEPQIEPGSEPEPKTQSESNP